MQIYPDNEIPYHQQFLSKQGEVIIGLSRLLMRTKNQERLPSVQELGHQLNAGAGTIQMALKHFENSGAIQLIPRGHQGTIVEKIDYFALQRYNAPSWLFGCMPLPYTLNLEGLATALYNAFEECQLPLKMSYVRGSKVRTKSLLEEKNDFIVCSRIAAELLLKESQDFEVLCSIGKNSYIRKCGIIFSESGIHEIRDGMKIGVDEDSLDHEYLNHTICAGRDVQFVKTKYSDIFNKLEAKKIDATVWSFDENRFAQFTDRVAVLTDDYIKDRLSASMEAVILVKKDHTTNLLMKELLKESLDSIREVQKEVIDHKRSPSF